MVRKSISSWIKAIRPFTFTGSVMPVTLGAVFAICVAQFRLGYFLLSILGIVSLQASANLLNDYEDYVNEVDTVDSQLSSGVIIDKRLTPEQVLMAGRIMMGFGFLIGIFLTVQRGLFILTIGLIGLACAYFYTGKPLTLKYRGLGAPVVFLLFGPFMTVGSYYVQTQRLDLSSVFISIPLGLMTTAILHANDIRDINLDKKAGIKTLSIIAGEAGAHKIYDALLLVSYISVLLMVFYRIIPYWSLLCFITAPGAFKCMKKLRTSGSTTTGLATFDKDTAELNAKFAIILILTVLIPNIVK